MLKQFGGKLTKELEKQYAQSPNWKDGKFQNLTTTTMEFSFQSIPHLLYKQFFDKKGREPKQPLSVVPFDKEKFLSAEKPAFIWYGHSVLLMRLAGKTILIDPMLGPDAAPIAPIGTKRFSENTLQLIDEFPPIDVVLLTHDHYDHLDLESIEKLKPKVKRYVVGMGVKRHLERWEIPSEMVTEMDWWNAETEGKVSITYTPTRHFSGRGLTDREKSLWGGWVLKTHEHSIYFSGDGGYGEHFKEVGQRLGPFDIGFMECGQYNKYWSQIHMFPEESVLAAIDAGVKEAAAVHWAGFTLAQHTWKDPIERFTASAKQKGLPAISPKLGEQFTPGKAEGEKKWWEEVE